MKQYTVAIAGATGAVGESMRLILEQRKFPVKQLHLLASERSVGNTLEWEGENIVVKNLADFDFSQTDIALFSAGGSVSEKHAHRASRTATVIDNTSFFRYQEDIPLIVPEVNPDHLSMVSNHNIIANPNCSTIQMLLALAPIHRSVGISRINVATYQAVSGSGVKAIEEMNQQLCKYIAEQSLGLDDAHVYSQPIGVNVLPQIDVFTDNGYTKEEMKMLWETRKILSDDNIKVNATCVRVPVKYGHSEAVHLETKEPISAEQVRLLLADAPGVVVYDDITNNTYPTALIDAAGQDPVFVGRIRKDISCENGINLWIVSDNIRKGAALNSVQIAELLIEKSML